MKRTLLYLHVFLLTWLTLAVGPGMAEEAEPPALSLANTYHDDVALGEYWVSEKLDGVRAFWDGEVLASRRGNRFIAPSWFVEGFPSEPLDGELWMGRGTFDALSGIVRRHMPEDDAWRNIRYMVFDLPAHPGTFDERLSRLKELLAGIDPSRIAMVEQFRVGAYGELTALLDRVVEQGGEGLMLRRGRSRYLAGRSDDLLKLKTYQDAEAVVVAHIPGKGKYTGMMGSLLVEMPDGRRFRLGTGFSDETRRSPPPVGTTVTYKHHGKTGTGLPRFASFLRVRKEI